MRLKELSTINGAEGLGLVKTLLSNPLFAAIEQEDAWRMSATDVKYDTYNGKSQLKTLREGAAYEFSDAKFDRTSVTDKLKYYYSNFSIAKTRERDAALGFNNMDIWIKETRDRTHRDFVKDLTKAILTDNGEDAKMKGLLTRLDGVTRLAGFTDTTKFPQTDYWDYTRVLNAKDFSKTPGATSLDISKDDAAAYRQFYEMFNFASNTTSTKYTHVMVSQSFAPRFITIANELKLTGYDYVFGEQVQTVGRYKVIVVPNDVITNKEPDDKPSSPNNDTTSLYFFGFAPYRLALGTNTGLEYMSFNHPNNTSQNAETWGMNLEWIAEDHESILRVKGIKA